MARPYAIYEGDYPIGINQLGVDISVYDPILALITKTYIMSLLRIFFISVVVAILSMLIFKTPLLGGIIVWGMVANALGAMHPRTNENSID